MVYSNAGALAFTPTAQHRNFEIWVVPRVQCASFADAKPADVQAVADVRRAPCRPAPTAGAIGCARTRRDEVHGEHYGAAVRVILPPRAAYCGGRLP